MVKNFAKEVNSVFGSTVRNRLKEYCEENPIDNVRLAVALHLDFGTLMAFKGGSDNLSSQQIMGIGQFLERRHY